MTTGPFAIIECVKFAGIWTQIPASPFCTLSPRPTVPSPFTKLSFPQIHNQTLTL